MKAISVLREIARKEVGEGFSEETFQKAIAKLILWTINSAS